MPWLGLVTKKPIWSVSGAVAQPASSKVVLAARASVVVFRKGFAPRLGGRCIRNEDRRACRRVFPDRVVVSRWTVTIGRLRRHGKHPTESPQGRPVRPADSMDARRRVGTASP